MATADDYEKARQLGLARAAGGTSRPESAVNKTADRLAKFTPSGLTGAVASKLGVNKQVGWVIGCIGCGCLTAVVGVLIPVFLLVISCKALKIC